MLNATERLQKLQANLRNVEGVVDYYDRAVNLLLGDNELTDEQILDNVKQFLNLFVANSDQQFIDSTNHPVNTPFTVRDESSKSNPNMYRLTGAHLSETEKDLLHRCTFVKGMPQQTLAVLCDYLNGNQDSLTLDVAIGYYHQLRLYKQNDATYHEEYLVNKAINMQLYQHIPYQSLLAVSPAATEDFKYMKRALNVMHEDKYFTISHQIRTEHVLTLTYLQTLQYIQEHPEHPWHGTSEDWSLEAFHQFIEGQHISLQKPNFQGDRRSGNTANIALLQACSFVNQTGNPAVMSVNNGSARGGHFIMISLTKDANNEFCINHLNGMGTIAADDLEIVNQMQEILLSLAGKKAKFIDLYNQGFNIQASNNCGHSIAMLYSATLLGIDPEIYLNITVGTDATSANSKGEAWNRFLATIAEFSKSIVIDTPAQLLSRPLNNHNISPRSSTSQTPPKVEELADEVKLPLVKETPDDTIIREPKTPKKEEPKQVVSPNTNAAQKQKGKSSNIITSELTSPLFKFYLNLYLLTSIMNTIKVEHALVSPDTELKFDKLSDYVTAARLINTQQTLAHRGDTLLHKLYKSFTSLCKTYGTICTLLEKDSHTAEIYYISKINYKACKTLEIEEKKGTSVIAA